MRILPSLFTLGVLVTAGVGWGQDEEGVMLTRSLSLRDCMMRAIQSNPDLRSEKLNVLIGEEQILAELAAFAWSIEAATVFENRDKPQNASEASANSRIRDRTFYEEHWRSRVALTRRFLPGTQVELGARYSRGETDLTRDSIFSVVNPEHEVFVGVTLTQPLLQGFGRRSTLAKTDIARLQTESARHLTVIKAMNLLAEVAARYTDVVAAFENLAVKNENIDRAVAMVERNRKLLESGKGVENDITKAELAVFQRRDDFLSTQVQKVERQNALAALINIGPETTGRMRFVPVSGYGMKKPLESRDVLIDQAIRKRSDLSYFRTVIDSARVNVRRARDGAKPRLNLVGSAGLYGLDNTFGSTIEEAMQNQGNEFSVGVEFRMELGGNQSGKSAIEIAKHQLTQAELGYGKARNTIALEVDTAYSMVLNARQRLETARKGQELARKNLEAEELLLEQSKGDLYRVIERQQLYGDASANVVASTALLSKAMIGLWLASGELFERYEITQDWIKSVVENPSNGK